MKLEMFSKSLRFESVLSIHAVSLWHITFVRKVIIMEAQLVIKEEVFNMPVTEHRGNWVAWPLSTWIKNTPGRKGGGNQVFGIETLGLSFCVCRTSQ